MRTPPIQLPARCVQATPADSQGVRYFGLSCLSGSVLPWLCLVLRLAANPVRAAEVYGHITDANTGQGLSAATIRVVAQDATDTNEFSVHSDVFGYYRILDVLPGNYTFEASHPAYQPDLDDLVLAEGQRAGRSAALNPLQPLEPHFDIDLGVACATTGYELDSVPVQVEVIPLTGGATVVRQGRTDQNGFCTIPGLPRGNFTFRINEGLARRPGWDSCVRQIFQSLDGPHWGDVFLKPEGRTLLVSVYGYDPVKQQENVLLGGIWVELTGVHPEDPALDLVPVQVGVSGLRRENELTWDNSLAGKVRFTGLPPIHWRLTGKRLGYQPGTVLITTDAQAQLVPSEPRLDLTLMNTRLVAVLSSPYNDPQMLHGMNVRLQGLPNSSTEGIDRKANAVYDDILAETTATFDRLLPGTYRLAINDVVTNTVPILIEGQLLPGGESPTRFVARMVCEERVDAVADQGVEVDAALTVEPTVLRGRILAINTEHVHSSPLKSGALEYVDYPAAGQSVEIRASEYFTNRLASEFHVQRTETDFNGEFSVTLLPGLYGVVLPGLTGYWGTEASTIQTSVSDPRRVERNWIPWPQYQRWPFSYASLQSFGYGVLAVSSDRHAYAELPVSQNYTQIQFTLNRPTRDPTWRQVLALYGEVNKLQFLLEDYEDFASATLSLLGGPGGPLVGRPDGQYVWFDRVPPGSGYHFVFDHPRYQLTAAAAQQTFDFFEPAPPGVLPATPPPGAGPTRLQNVVYKSGLLEFINPGTAIATVWKWNEERRAYDEVATQRKPDYIKPAYTGDRVFKYYNTTPSAYEAWWDLSSFFDDGKEHWYAIPSENGSIEKDIYIGGDRAVASAPFIQPPLRVAYNLKVLARNAHGRREPLDGVQVLFNEGGVAVSGGPPLTGRTKSYDFRGSNVTFPGWEYGGSETTAEAAGSSALITITVFMQQQTTLQGRIVNARTGSPVANAAVRLTKAQGNKGEELPLSAADGSFVWTGYANRVLRHEVNFLEIDARGYAPYRLRLDPTNSVPGGALVLEGINAIRLEPLPAPELLTNTISFDRFGAFLPGVKRAGNQDAFNAFTADEPLTMTWSLQVRNPTNYSLTIPGFDTLDDQPGPMQSLTFTDAVSEVWLIDARSFTNNPDSDPPVPLVLPSSADPHLVHDWLAKIHANDTNTPNVFHRIRSNLRTPDDTNVVAVAGQLKLWLLPPDEFKPVFVAVTQRGAVAVHPFAYTGEDTKKALVGFRRPQWLGALGDTMGLVAGSVPMVEDRLRDLKNAFPAGRFVPLPKFTMDIYRRATDFLDYTYALDVNITEGMHGTGGGMARLLPGRYGFDLFAGMEATLKGEDREFYLQLKGGVGKASQAGARAKTGSAQNPEVRTPITSASVNRSAYAPGLSKSVRVNLKPPPSGSLVHITSELFGPQNEPQQLRVLYGIQGEIGVEAKVNLVPALSVIPTVGQVLLGLNRAEVLNIDGLIDGALGLRSLTAWTTEFPQTWEHNSTLTLPETSQPRRHFLGGNETGSQNGQHQWDLCFRTGLGVGVDVWNGALGGSGKIAVAGYDCWTATKSLYCEGNTLGDWPPIKRIRGDARLEFDLFIDAWVVKYGRHWDFPFVAIDHQFKTTANAIGEKRELRSRALGNPIGATTEFYLYPMTITSFEVRVTDFDPATFDRRSPQVVRECLPLGTFCADGAAGVAFIDMLEGRREMGLRFILRTGPQSWSDPVLIAQTPGAIIDAALAATPDDQAWVAVWTVIAQAHVGDNYPPSTIWYSVRNAQTGSWSAPAILADLAEVGQQLRLVPFNSGLALIFLQTDEGLRARNYEALGSAWNGTNWTAPQPLLAATPISGFAVVGTEDNSRLPLQLGYVDADSTLQIVRWDGQSASAPQALTSPAGNDLAFALAPDAQYLTWTRQTGGLGLFSFQANSNQWVDQGIVINDVNVQELQTAFLHDAIHPVLLHVWTQGGDHAALWYSFSDPSGTTLGSAVNLTENTHGHYHHPALLAADDRCGTVLSLFGNGGSEELRQFDLQYPIGSVNTDRDADGLNDIRELLVVDADPLDPVRTIDDVRPDDDFDHDGFPNRRELAAGSHPANAEIYPALQIVLEPATARELGAQWRIEGGDWLPSGQALYLKPGQYQIEFKDTVGWTAPATQEATIEAGVALSLICPYVQGGVTFDEWIRSQVPPLPVDRSGPGDTSGPLGLHNFVAYALGVNPMTATAAALPSLRREGERLIYTYQRSKTAVGTGYRVYFAPMLAAAAWNMPEADLHHKVSETDTTEVWELNLAISDTPSQGFLSFEIWQNASPEVP